MKLKTLLPSCFLMFIVFHLLWALWGELSYEDSLFNLGVFFLFSWALVRFINNRWRQSLIIELAFLAGWCGLMFLAYENADYSYVAKNVSFLGFIVDSHARIMIYTFLLLIPGIILSESFSYKNSRIVKIIIFVILVTSLFYSVRAVIVFPDALRARRTTAFLGYEDILYGTPTYAIVYSLCLYVPYFLARYSLTKGRTKLYYVLMVACLFIIVTISQFATALLALLLGLFVFWFMSSNRYSGSVLSRIVVTSILIIMLFIRTPIADLFSSLAESVTGAWAEKLEELAQFMRGDGTTGGLASRISLYSDSLSVFRDSPLFGMIFSGAFDGEIGGHSSLFDMLALTGISGTLLFIGAVYNARKRMQLSTSGKVNKAAINAITITYIFLALTKNIITALSVNFSFFVMLPILFSMKESSVDEYI